MYTPRDMESAEQKPAKGVLKYCITHNLGISQVALVRGWKVTIAIV